MAANKLNDIVHLGRGVSAGLADRRSNIEQLQQRSLPILSTPADVANALGVAAQDVRVKLNEKIVAELEALPAAGDDD